MMHECHLKVPLKQVRARLTRILQTNSYKRRGLSMPKDMNATTTPISDAIGIATATSTAAALQLQEVLPLLLIQLKE